jgi:hypothetical protein
MKRFITREWEGKYQVLDTIFVEKHGPEFLAIINTHESLGTAEKERDQLNGVAERHARALPLLFRKTS